MARNFDDGRRAREQETRDQREFVLGGETFYARLNVRPEALTRWEAIDSGTPAKPATATAPAVPAVPGTPLTEVLEIVDEAVLAMIENIDDAHARYRALRESTDDPIGVQDLLEVAQWLVETVTGRPTEQPSVSSTPSPSERTDDDSGTTSTDGSSSEVTPTASAVST